MIDKNKLVCIMSIVLLGAVLVATGLFSSCEHRKSSVGDDERAKDKREEDKVADYTVVLDAGHGGVDPGKVGVDGQLEKDINLQITMKIKEILEKHEDKKIEVVLTREDDMGHYSESDSNKKMADMTKRCEIVNGVNADVLVSIHQNSYHSSSVKGAQVFYYEESTEGKKLASVMQAELVERLEEDGKGRVEKANDNYYILLNVSCPAVIVECGFLSNPEEAAALDDVVYQEKVATAIAEGIVRWLET